VTPYPPPVPPGPPQLRPGPGPGQMAPPPQLPVTPQGLPTMPPGMLPPGSLPPGMPPGVGSPGMGPVGVPGVAPPPGALPGLGGPQTKPGDDLADIHEPDFDPSQIGPRPPRPRQGSLESIADELAEWVEGMSASIAGSLLDDQGRPPFGAPVTGAERLRYYDRQFFLPDGRPNLEGRQREAQRLGEAAYQQTLARVGLARQRGALTREPAGDAAAQQARRMRAGWAERLELPPAQESVEPLEQAAEALYG
jgi:hypothetical protein